MRKTEKRKGWILLTVMIILTMMMSVSGEAAFKAVKKNVNYPVQIKAGQLFSIRGTVTANTRISKAVVSIYNSSGKKCLQKYTAAPGGYVFDIAAADANIEFNKLAAGEYYYLVSIYNTSGKKLRILKKKFTVTGNSTKNTITKTGVTYPTTLEVGKIFKMAGSITANFKMKKIVFTIYQGNTCRQRYTATVNGTSYDIKKADPYLDFQKLKAGQYYYRISVYNTANKKTRILDKLFTVSAPGVIRITGSVPASDFTINQGSAVSVGGRITSTYNLTSVIGSITNQAGNYVYRGEAAPNAKSFELKNSLVDYALHFEKLKPGTYTYKIVATDAQKKQVQLVSRKVVVK